MNNHKVVREFFNNADKGDDSTDILKNLSSKTKFLKAASVDTNYSEVSYDDHIRMTIDWSREKSILERKRRVTILMIVLAFLVTAAMMIMSVVHVERNKMMEFGEHSCSQNNTDCFRLLCQWQSKGEDDLIKCDEVSINNTHADTSYHESDQIENIEDQNKLNNFL